MKKAFFCLFAFPLLFAVRVTSGLSHEREVSPGAIYSDHVNILNTTGESERIKVYLADYHFNAKGETHFPEPGSSGRSNAKWIHLKSHEFTLSPGASFKLPFTVSVPKEELEGTYWSVILVEPVVPVDSSKTYGMGIRSIIRYAVQVVTNIEGTGKVDLKVLNNGVITEGDRKYYQFDVENRGTRVVSPNLWMNLFAIGGKEEGKVIGEKTRLYPGTSVQHRLDISDVDEGKYNALIIFDEKNADFFGHEDEIKIQ